MKVFICLLLVAFAAADTVPDGAIFDLFNIRDLMRDETTRGVIMDCIMERKPCGEYQLIRDHGPNVLRTQCGDCTPEQKEKFVEVIKDFERDYKEEYKQLKAAFIPAAA